MYCNMIESPYICISSECGTADAKTGGKKQPVTRLLAKKGRKDATPTNCVL